MRSRFLSMMMVVLAVAGGPASATATDHADWKRCGSQKDEGAGWYDVRSRHVSCRDARAVARKYWDNGGPDHVRVDGVTYHCKDEPIAEEASRVRCRAGEERRVRFKVGA